MELPAHWRDWDLGMELADDVAGAEWVVASVRPWGREGDPDFCVASILPDRYAAYARILHPAHSRSGDVRWAGLAARTGVRIGPETGFCAASGLDPTEDRDAWDATVPSDGSLPEAGLAALGVTVAPFTSTPETCVYCFWAGWGCWGGGVGYSLAGDATAEQRDAIVREAVARAEAEEAQLAPIPLVRLPHRDHYLFTAPLARTQRAFRLDRWERSPSMWWPADRAWFVATEIDGYSTYVGGSVACIDAVLTSPGLEAIPVDADTPLDPWVYG